MSVGHKGASGILCAGVLLNDNRAWLRGGVLFLIDRALTASSSFTGAIFVATKGRVTCSPQASFSLATATAPPHVEGQGLGP